MTTIEINGLLVDDETGEVQGGVPEGVTTLELLQRNYLDAREQEDSWKAQKAIYALALRRYLEDHHEGEDRQGEDTRYARSVIVKDSVTRKAPAANVHRAAQAELISADVAEHLLIAAAKDLDVQAVEDFIAETTSADILRALLIDEIPRSGYVRVTRVAQPAPEIIEAL